METTRSSRLPVPRSCRVAAIFSSWKRARYGQYRIKNTHTRLVSLQKDGKQRRALVHKEDYKKDAKIADRLTVFQPCKSNMFARIILCTWALSSVAIEFA